MDALPAWGASVPPKQWGAAALQLLNSHAAELEAFWGSLQDDAALLGCAKKLAVTGGALLQLLGSPNPAGLQELWKALQR